MVSITNMSIQGSNIKASLATISSVASLVVIGLTLSDSSVGQSLIKLINTNSSVIEDV